MSHDSERGRAGMPGWRASLVAVCIAEATAIVGFDFTLPFVPLYLQHDLGVHGLGQTALWAGLIGFGPAIPATIFGPLWGRVADRFGYRAMLLRATLCAGLLLTLMGFAPTPAVLLGLRMIQGALTGTVFAAQALVAASVPERETGRAMGLIQMSISVGATLGPVGGGAVSEFVGFRPTFVCAGVLLALSAAVVFIFVREPEKRIVARGAHGERPSMKSVLMIPAFAAALALTLATQLASTGIFPVIPLFVQDLLHSAHDVARDTGLVMALSGLSAAGGAYLAGRLQRRLGLRPLIISAITFGALLLLPQAWSHGLTDFLILRCLAAFSLGAVSCLVGTWAAVSSPPDAKGTAFGLMGAASSIGFGAGPLLGGAEAATFGIRTVFIVSAAMLAMIPMVFVLSSALGPALRRLQVLPQPSGSRK